MGKLIFRTELKREKGKLYYVKDDANGNMCIYEAIMARGKKKKRGQ